MKHLFTPSDSSYGVAYVVRSSSGSNSERSSSSFSTDDEDHSPTDYSQTVLYGCSAYIGEDLSEEGDEDVVSFYSPSKS